MEAALLYYGRKKILDNTPIPLSLEKDNDPRLFTSPLKFPGKLAVDVENNRLFISDSNHNRIVGSLSLAPTPSLFLETLLHSCTLCVFFFFAFSGPSVTVCLIWTAIQPIPYVMLTMLVWYSSHTCEVVLKI